MISVSSAAITTARSTSGSSPSKTSTWHRPYWQPSRPEVPRAARPGGTARRDGEDGVVSGNCVIGFRAANSSGTMATMDIEKLRTIRVEDPAAIQRAAVARSRSSMPGRMMLIAADHPARGSLAARGRPQAMADRGELLARLVAALERPGVDGVVGTPDIVEDLLLLGVLEGKIVIGSMNRGGLAGSVFELDDRFTAYDAGSISAMGLDGGKMLTRIALDDPATARTLEHSGAAVSALAAEGLMAMVEPFMSRLENAKVVNDLTPDAVIKSAAIASGLGNTSRHTWLKLPVVEEMERVMASTTLPTLLLGGDPTGPDEEVFAGWAEALELPGVRGLVVGRSILFPQNDDVAAAVDLAASLVSRG